MRQKHTNESPLSFLTAAQAHPILTALPSYHVSTSDRHVSFLPFCVDIGQRSALRATPQRPSGLSTLFLKTSTLGPEAC